ncbi:MAG: hypothetical protein RL711_991 [Bacteroidota bacterium]
MTPFILVSQSFGKESEYRRVILTMLSAAAHLGEDIGACQFVLFTDNIDFFKQWLNGLNVHYVLLTPTKVKQMRGDIDFLHRMKIALIEESFALFPNRSMFYVDSDTFFVQNPMLGINRIDAQTSSMHLLEYPFSDIKNMPLPAGKTFQAFYQLAIGNQFTLANGDSLQVVETDASWNAGVMCLHHSHVRFLPDVYGLTNQFYPQTLNHASEQYAFSILLQKNTQLIPSEDVVYHYWYRIKKDIMDEILAEKDFMAIENQALAAKIAFVKNLTIQLPERLAQHVYTLIDHSVQAFNENKFGEGYRWFLKAIFKNPSKAITLWKDVLYHAKRQISK